MENNGETPRLNGTQCQNVVPSTSANQVPMSNNNPPGSARLEFGQVGNIPQNSRIAYFLPASDLPNLIANNSSSPGEQCRYFIIPGSSHGENGTQNSRSNDLFSHAGTDPLSAAVSHTPTLISCPSETRYVGVKIAAEMVPIFNGNTPPVTTFIRDCKFAEQSVHPGDRPFLTKLIRTRVKGDANAYLQNTNEPENLGELLDILRLAFSPQGDLSQLQADMSSVIQRNSESVLQYGIRVSEILRKTIETIDQSFPVEAAAGMRLGANRNGTSCFIRGLNPEIESRVSPRNPISLQHAISIATLVESEVSHLKQLHRVHSPNSSINAPTVGRFYTDVKQVAHIQGQEAGPSKQNDARCYNCGKKGHYKRQCRSKPSHFSDSKNEKNVQRNQNVKICGFCDMKGHLAEKCILRAKFEHLKEQFFRNRNQGSHWKEKRGHESSNEKNSRKLQNRPSDESSAP